MTTCSLLISTYNWPQALKLVLKSALIQSRMPDEILIADDGSREETRLLVEDFRQASPFPIRHFWQEDLGFRKSKILNKALARCATDYVIQVDGDCIMHPEFVKDHMDSARKGVYLYGPRVDILPGCVEGILASEQIEFKVFADQIKHKTRNYHNPFISSLYRPKPIFSDRFRGCNASFWLEDVVAINGYNEDYEGWGREDSDLVIRLMNAGIRSKRLKFAGIVYHIDHPVNSRDRLEQNDRIQREVIARRIVRIENGLSQYLESTD